MKKEEFEKLVEEALALLPERFQKFIDNLAVIVDDTPPQEVYRRTGSSPFGTVLGLYHGVPFKHRGPFYGNIPPDVIFVYKKPIEAMCRSREAIRQKVKEVVFHEIGHYFGLSDRELQKIEDEAHESQEKK